MVITIAIILFYFLFILKLKPSEKVLYKSSNEKLPELNMLRTEFSTAEIKNKPLQNYLDNSGNNLTLKTAGPATSLREETNKTEETVVLKPSEDQKEPSKSKDDLKAFFLYGKVDFKGCTFKYGYLKTMPKYKPIPHECFGCPHILECVGSNDKKSEHDSANKERLRQYYGY